MRLIIIRHGETIYNLEGRFQGLSDIDLNERGKKQAKKLAKRLKKENISIIYSSPLKRAIKTAIKIKDHHPNSDFIINDNLKEINYGDFEGKTVEEIKQEFGETIWNKRVRDKYSFETPGGESYKQAEKRAKKVLDRIINKNKDSAIVSHGGISRLFIKQLTDKSFSEVNKHSLKNASVTIFNKSKGWELEKLNCDKHLR